MLKKSILFLFPIALLTACSNSTDLAIDNPTSDVVHCYVDSLYVEVPPKEVVWVEMGKGNHKITLDNDSVVAFNFTAPVYMVNPSMSEYLMYEEIYGTSMISSSIPTSTVSMFGLEFEGNYKVFRDVINTVEWDYGPRESTPEMIEIEQGDRPSVMKLMDQGEVMAQMFSGMDEGSEETDSESVEETIESLLGQ